MAKKAMVYTNDKKRSALVLTVTGKVDKFADISTTRVTLRGYAGRKISESVRIIPVEKYPFKILETKAKNGKYIRFELTELKDSKRPGYVLTIENIRKGKGRYFDYIALKTDSKIKPELRIGVFGYIKERETEKPKKTPEK